MHNDSLRAKPKQKRGQMRVQAIINAASEVFAEVGYENATMIEIAARADTSVGSLYQFFSNKESVLKALVERYVNRATEVFSAMDVESFSAKSFEEGIRAILVPLKTFIRDNRDFQVIFASSGGSALVAEAIRPMDEAFQTRMDAVLTQIAPQLSPQDRYKYRMVGMMVMKALLTLAHPSSELTLDEVFAELEAVYIRYYKPIMQP
jgi:AcrR family transcriptional regulator